MSADESRFLTILDQLLAVRHKRRFHEEWRRSLVQQQTRLSDGSSELQLQAESMLAAQSELQTAARRLEIARHICAKALASGNLSPSTRRFWSDLDLAGTDLRRADLRGVDITGSELIDAQLHGAKIDGETKLDKVNWWDADFRLEREADSKISEDLLEELWKHFGQDVPSDLNAVHPSCREFLRRKRA